jgi:Uma2 family endonuclease
VTELARKRFSFAEYLRLEEESGVRHEFFDGVAYAMAGGSAEHAAVTANIIRHIGNALEGRPCRVYTPDLRVRVAETGLTTYPDASVICDGLETDPEDKQGHTALNPTLLVEVLSPSTENYDRGEKLAHYKRIPTVREIMLVAHDERRVDLWRRTKRGWTQRVFRDGESVELTSLECALPVRDIYFDAFAESREED